MTGHALPQVAEAVHRRALDGLTTMLPSPDAAWVAEAGPPVRPPRWQMAMTATDANRFVLRFARHLTGRPKICGDGLVLPRHRGRDAGRARRGPGGAPARALGPQVDVALTTKVVPFNDVEALERAWPPGTWPRC